MSIKHSKGRRMGAFDWFIGSCLIFIARCREILASLIPRVQWRDFIRIAGKKELIEEDGHRRGIQNFIL